MMISVLFGNESLKTHTESIPSYLVIESIKNKHLNKEIPSYLENQTKDSLT